MRRLLPLFFGLSVLLAGRAATGAAPARGTFLQRRSDRYTSRDGVPPGPIGNLSVRGNSVVVWGTVGARFVDGRWKPADRGDYPNYVTGGSLRYPLPANLHATSIATASDGTLWAVTNRGALHVDEKGTHVVRPPVRVHRHQPAADPDAKLTCVAVDRLGMVWFGSDRGLFATDGGELWNVIDGKTGLPYEHVTAIAFGEDGDLWAGTTEGVCRLHEGSWQYSWGPRWLPGNHVLCIASDGKGGAWVGTDKGVAHLWDQPVTLEEKARHYEEITAARHNRDGFIYRARLKTPGDPSAGVVFEASDNDGLWTSLYVAAEAFRYAATHDPEAKQLARKSMRAMLDLVRYSGVSGFPARAIIRDGEAVDGYDPDETVRIPDEKDKIWYRSPVDKTIRCKGDTSSDELDGHYFAWRIYYDLVADNEEKAEIRRVVQAVTDNILNHDLTLVGPTGRRTRWGVWDPADLNDNPVWWEERGLNSLELLAYLKVADHICGLPRYRQKWDELVQRHHYLLNTVNQKIEGPWWEVNHSDDEMAFMMYLVSLWGEERGDARRVLLQSLERSWQIERPEASPFFNYLYGACVHHPADADASESTLQEWPWDLVEWEARGSHRSDVSVRSHREEQREKRELTRVLPPSERPLMQWNGNPYESDGGTAEGTSEGDGAAWLVSYWMGRYFHLLEPGR